jgi:hypothetical protein
MDPTKTPPPCGIKFGKASSLRALVNNINFVGGAGSGARGMDPTKAPPPCGIKFGAGMLSRGVSSVGKDHISISISLSYFIVAGQIYSKNLFSCIYHLSSW